MKEIIKEVICCYFLKALPYIKKKMEYAIGLRDFKYRDQSLAYHFVRTFAKSVGNGHSSNIVHNNYLKILIKYANFEYLCFDQNATFFMKPSRN